MDAGAALDQQPRDPAAGEFGQDGADIGPAAGIARGLDHLDAAGFERAAAIGGGKDQRRNPAGGLRELRPFAQAQPRVEHHADGRTVLQPRQAASQLGIVGQRGLDADQDRVAPGAQQMAEAAGFFARDPLALAGDGRGLAVEALGDLQRDQRPARPQAQEEAGIEAGRLLLQDTGRDLDAGLPQHGEALAADARIGVLDRRDDARDAGRDQCIGAGRRLAQMRTGLQRHIGGGAPRRLARLRQRHGLGMRPPARLCPTASQHPAFIGNDDAAHRRIGRRAAQSPRRQRERVAHMLTVVHGG